MYPRHYAFLMMLLFVAVVVVGRVAVQFYLTGNSGIRSGTKLKTLKEILISFFMFGVMGAQVLLTWRFAFSNMETHAELSSLSAALGLTLCIAGILFTSYAQYSMGKEWRIGVDPKEKTELITTGIYSRVRNPIYTGCIIHGIGVVLLAPNLMVFITGLIGYFSIRAYVNYIEEPHLIALHGEEYRQYMNRTGSFFPQL